jgi:hypothetical protein
MKKMLIILGIVITLMIIGYLIDESNQVSIPKTTTTGTPRPAVNIEPKFKDEFMKGCVSPAASYAYCLCAYNEMRKDYSYQDFVDLESKTEDEITAYVMPYVNLCTGKLESN